MMLKGDATVAERLVRQLIDGLDGAEIPAVDGERVTFSLRGVDYQIDLSNINGHEMSKGAFPQVFSHTRRTQRLTADPQ